MKYFEKFASLILICMFGFQGFAQTTAGPSEIRKAPFAFGLFDGTPIRMRINRTVSSADAKVDDTVDFEVLEDIKVGDVIVIPRGGVALATITEAKPRRNMGRSGRLNMNIDSVRLTTGEKIPLRAVKEVKGGSNSAAMTGAIVATAIIFFPAAPLFLFMKGKDITIPKGTEITAYVNGDISLDQTRFISGTQSVVPPAVVANGQPSSLLESETSGISIKSTPDGAEILVDGNFVGNTPSTLRLKAGGYKITIKKSGYLDWQRTITLSAGSNINLDASLEKSTFSATSTVTEGPATAPIQAENQNTNVNPNQSGRNYNEGGYYKFGRKEYSGAESSYRAAIAAEPNNAIYHSNLAATLNAQKKFDEAEKEMELASRLSPDDPNHKKNLNIIRSNKNLDRFYLIEPKF